MNRTVMCMLRGLLLGAAIGSAFGIAASRVKNSRLTCFKKKACKALHSMGALVDAVGYLMK